MGVVSLNPRCSSALRIAGSMTSESNGRGAGSNGADSRAAP